MLLAENAAHSRHEHRYQLLGRTDDDPRFVPEDDEREFWAITDASEYFDASSARQVVFPNLKPSEATISLRLPQGMLDELKTLAHARDVPYQSLLKVILAHPRRPTKTPGWGGIHPKCWYIWTYFIEEDEMPYHAKAATVGNSKALRLDAALFREHPEFGAGEFAVSVIAPGCMLVQATAESNDDEKDPVFDAFLTFIEHQMVQRPDLLSAVTDADRREADALLTGVPADHDADLGDDFELPEPRPRKTSVRRGRKAASK